MTECKIQIISRSTSGCPKVGGGLKRQKGAIGDPCEFGTSQRQPLGAQPGPSYSVTLDRRSPDHWSHSVSDFRC